MEVVDPRTLEARKTVPSAMRLKVKQVLDCHGRSLSYGLGSLLPHARSALMSYEPRPDHGAGSRGGRNERRLRRKKRSVNGCDCKNFILDLRFRVSVVPPSHFTYHLIIICNLLSYLWELS